MYDCMSRSRACVQCNCMAAHLGSLSLYHKTPRRYSNNHGYHCYQYVFVDDVVIIVVDKDTDTDTTSTTSTTFTTSTTSTTSSTSTTSTTSTTSNTSNF